MPTYVEQHLNGKTWFCGDDLTGADFMMSFPLQIAVLTQPKSDYPDVPVSQVENHPGYWKAVVRVGAPDLHLL